MSVITTLSSEESIGRGEGKCRLCKETLDHYPFLEWGGGAILLCAKCCAEIK
jgi:hypothetical protein